MPLVTGSRLGSYEILAPIGAGGMGEVYRARDSKLGRDVAIKVLPETFAREPDRMARFGREAKLLASLNHSNIAAIHGLEDTNNTHALVMELAEGPTLADRIAQGPIPIEDALKISKQIAEALEYAHEKGIIHRDLKPANVKVANDDTVKILDFGLAKAMESEAASFDISTSPTISRMATQTGVLLGTAAYMSPEQAKAKPVDRRTDIWAFGCVVYEMLTGKKAFDGDTVPETLGALMRAEPDWSHLPAATPMRVRVLLQRCLQKDPKQRLRDIGEARISLEEVLSGAAEGSPSLAAGRPGQQWWSWLGWGVAAVCLLVAVAGWLAFLYLRPKPLARPSMRFEIPLPERLRVDSFALSPDGRNLAFISASAGAGAQRQVWVRSLDTLEARPLGGTEGAAGWPFWSPNGRYIAFGGQAKLRKVEATGGPPVTLCDAPLVLGGAWNRDDVIVFGSTTGLYRVAASGGSPSPIITGGAYAIPYFLPDAHHFVYLRVTDSMASGTGIYVGSVDAKGQEQLSKKLLSDVSMAVYTPSADPTVGYLLFVRGASGLGSLGTLMAQRFDVRRSKLTGEAVPIAEQVPNTSFSTSDTDVLVYMAGALPAGITSPPGTIGGQLTWFDREGKVLGAVGDHGVYRSLALSPDGKRVAVERLDPQNSGNRDIWLYDFVRGVSTRFTFDSSPDIDPVWSPDGSRIAFGSSRGGQVDLYEKASNLAGQAKPLFKSHDNKVPGSWSPDGRFLLYYNPIPPAQLWLLPLRGGHADRKPVLVEHSDFSEALGRFSPNGRWIAYVSNESGRDEIYVRPLDAPSTMRPTGSGNAPITGKWMVSKDGGISPVWGRDGKELFYLSPDGMAMAVDVNTSGVFQAGVPKAMFKVPVGVLFWDVSPNGKRFLMPAPSSASGQSPFTVVLNWNSGLKK